MLGGPSITFNATGLTAAIGLNGQSNAANASNSSGDFERWGFFATGSIGRDEAEAGSINPAFDYDINGLNAGVY